MFDPLITLSVSLIGFGLIGLGLALMFRRWRVAYWKLRCRMLEEQVDQLEAKICFLETRNPTWKQYLSNHNQVLSAEFHSEINHQGG